MITFSIFSCDTSFRKGIANNDIFDNVFYFIFFRKILSRKIINVRFEKIFIFDDILDYFQILSRT